MVTDDIAQRYYWSISCLLVISRCSPLSVCLFSCLLLCVCVLAMYNMSMGLSGIILSTFIYMRIHAHVYICNSLSLSLVRSLALSVKPSLWSHNNSLTQLEHRSSDLALVARENRQDIQGYYPIYNGSDFRFSWILQTTLHSIRLFF